MKLLGECLMALYILMLYGILFIASLFAALLVGIISPPLGFVIPFAAFIETRKDLNKKEGCLACFSKLKEALKFKQT